MLYFFFIFRSNRRDLRHTSCVCLYFSIVSRPRHGELQDGLVKSLLCVVRLFSEISSVKWLRACFVLSRMGSALLGHLRGSSLKLRSLIREQWSRQRACCSFGRDSVHMTKREVQYSRSSNF